MFPSSRTQGTITSILGQIEKVTAKTGIEFTAHDLRRTFATLLNDLETSDIAIKRLMNHKSRNITERYIQTKAATYTGAMDRLHQLINVGHDWTLDEGEGQFESRYAWMDNEAISRLQLFYVLYGETLDAIVANGGTIDWEYVDPTYHPLHGITYEELEAEEERLARQDYYWGGR